MQDKTRTIKVRSGAYRKLKILAAERGTTMLDLIDQLVDRELKRDEPTNDTDGQAKKST